MSILKIPLIIAFFSFCFVYNSIAQKEIVDPNAQVRSVGTFEAISISGAFDVIISQGDQTVVVVSASDPAIRDLITTEVRGNTLYLGFKKSNFDFRSSRRLKAYISFPDLKNIEMGGSGDIRVEGVLQVESLGVTISGSSDFNGTIEAKDLKLSSSGSSDFKLSGKVDNLKILVSGSSDISAFGLKADNVDITCSGNSEIEVTVEKEMIVSVSGTSAISYSGNGVITRQNLSGKSSITKKD